MKTFDECINEKQNFIFGGKAGLTGKEYGTVKTFDKLEAGDTYYLWKFGHNFELKDKDERNVTTVTRNEVKLSIEFKSEGEGKAMNRFEHKYTDDDTMLVMSGTNYYFYATYDMTDEEAIKKIKEKQDSNIYKTW